MKEMQNNTLELSIWDLNIQEQVQSFQMGQIFNFKVVVFSGFFFFWFKSRFLQTSQIWPEVALGLRLM